MNSLNYNKPIVNENQLIGFHLFGSIETYLFGMMDIDISNASSNRWNLKKMINWVMRCLMIATHIYWFWDGIGITLDAIKSSAGTTGVLFGLSVNLCQTGCLVIVIIMIRRHKKINSLMEKVCQQLNQSNIKKLRLINHLITFSYFLLIFLLSLANCYGYWNLYQNYHLVQIIAHISHILRSLHLRSSSS